jgi:predicted naringenin-chalcone synthase
VSNQLKNSEVDILALEAYEAPYVVMQGDFIKFQERTVQGWSAAMSRLVMQTGVRRRYSFLPDWEDYFYNKVPKTAERNALYDELIYPELIHRLQSFLHTNSIDTALIGGIITVSCTGITNPTLDTRIASELGLRSCQHWHLGFMGCHGGLVGLQSGAALCNLVPGKIVLVICVEACSLHYQRGTGVGIQTSNSLFSDGLAIVVMQKRDDDSRAATSVLRMIKSNTRTFSEGAEYLTWTMTDTGWVMGLSPKLPGLISKVLKDDAFADIRDHRNIVVHPGGRAILKAVQNGLEISDLESSYFVLSQYGNMSSATIFFCLREFLKLKKSSLEEIVLMAFGPGLDVSTVSLVPQ